MSDSASSFSSSSSNISNNIASRNRIKNGNNISGLDQKLTFISKTQKPLENVITTSNQSSLPEFKYKKNIQCSQNNFIILQKIKGKKYYVRQKSNNPEALTTPSKTNHTKNIIQNCHSNSQLKLLTQYQPLNFSIVLQNYFQQKNALYPIVDHENKIVKLKKSVQDDGLNIKKYQKRNQKKTTNHHSAKHKKIYKRPKRSSFPHNEPHVQIESNKTSNFYEQLSKNSQKSIQPKSNSQQLQSSNKLPPVQQQNILQLNASMEDHHSQDKNQINDDIVYQEDEEIIQEIIQELIDSQSAHIGLDIMPNQEIQSVEHQLDIQRQQQNMDQEQNSIQKQLQQNFVSVKDSPINVDQMQSEQPKPSDIQVKNSNMSIENVISERIVPGVSFSKTLFYPRKNVQNLSCEELRFLIDEKVVSWTKLSQGYRPEIICVLDDFYLDGANLLSILVWDGLEIKEIIAMKNHFIHFYPDEDIQKASQQSIELCLRFND